MNVLLVDDDVIFNLLNRKVLEGMGMVEDIHTAFNGAGAINLFNDYYSGSRSLPDVILLDLNMPIMDGFGFLDAFKNLPVPNKENIRIMIVSSSADPKDISRAKEMGVRHYLNKPITKEKLLSAFREN